jgi:Protein of unknown function (DUF1488)
MLRRAVIDFPNQSRVFDRIRRAVHFWGYDSAMEWSFFIGEDALKRVQPDIRPDEAGFLRAFDLNRTLIQAAATKAYKRERKAWYELTMKDFATNGWLARGK